MEKYLQTFEEFNKQVRRSPIQSRWQDGVTVCIKYKSRKKIKEVDYVKNPDSYVMNMFKKKHKNLEKIWIKETGEILYPKNTTTPTSTWIDDILK